MSPSKSMLLTVLSLILHYSVLAQNQERKYYGDENYLRACIRWNDSTEYQTSIYTSEDRTVYKFQMRNLFWGIYESREIYVTTYKRRLNKFNPARQLGRDYFWTLRKTEHSIDGEPIYMHSGNF